MASTYVRKGGPETFFSFSREKGGSRKRHERRKARSSFLWGCRSRLSIKTVRRKGGGVRGLFRGGGGHSMPG